MYIVQSGGQWPPFSSMFVYRDHPQRRSFQSPTELYSKERSSPKRSFPKRLPQQRSTTQTITWITEINPTKIIPIYVDHPNPQQRLPQQNQQKLIMPYNVCFLLCHQIFFFFYYVTKCLFLLCHQMALALLCIQRSAGSPCYSVLRLPASNHNPQ